VHETFVLEGQEFPCAIEQRVDLVEVFSKPDINEYSRFRSDSQIQLIHSEPHIHMHHFRNFELLLELQFVFSVFNFAEAQNHNSIGILLHYYERTSAIIIYDYPFSIGLRIRSGELSFIILKDILLIILQTVFCYFGVSYDVIEC